MVNRLSIMAIIVRVSGGFEMFLFSLIVTSNGIFVIGWLYCLFYEMKSQILNKCSYLYVCICLCGNMDKKKLIVERESIKVEHHMMKENFGELLRKVMSYVEEGKITLTRRNIEKFQ